MSANRTVGTGPDSHEREPRDSPGRVTSVDGLRSTFEQGLKSGKPVSIEHLLSSVPPSETASVLRELILIEVAFRRSMEQFPQLAEYVARFPDQIDCVEETFNRAGDGPATVILGRVVFEGVTDCPPAASGGDEQTSAESGRQHPPAGSSGSGAVSSQRVLDLGKKHDVSLTSESARQFAALMNQRYEVVSEIGAGGMGLVFRGRHISLGMDVAIKVLKQGASADRFLREARILAQVRSPYVVRIHDFDVLTEELPILVMEWVDGKDLYQVMSSMDGRVTEQRALPWMKHVCEGMQAAANEGIIHRDLKPSNILIDNHHHARVADFGLARHPTKTGNLSMEGDMMGTPYYMAPEQAEDPRSVDTRADIYSFGATFYHALTGEPPFNGNSAFGILFKHKTEPLISPRARLPDISAPISAILERCLAKSPADRFESFAALLRQFESSSGNSAWNATDEADLAGYLERYRARRDEYLNAPSSAELLDKYDFPDGRTLRIVVGDLARQNVEAIVSSDDGFLQMAGGVSASIRKAAGEQVADEARRFAPVRPGRAIATSAGALAARFIFHGITIGIREDRLFLPSPDIISEILSSCFYHADSLEVTSIAFPLLGTGTGGFDRDVCLDTTFRFLARTFLRGMTCVREARIVLYPQRSAPTQAIQVFKTIALPAQAPEVRGYQFFDDVRPGTQSPSAHFNYIPLADGRVAVVVADSPNKGVGTANLMRQLVAELQRRLAAEADLAHILAGLNDWLCREYPQRVVTMAAAVSNPATHEISLVNAGHVAPFIRRASQYQRRIEEIDDRKIGVALGTNPGSRYEVAQRQLGAGDVCVISTDGVRDARNASQEHYGESRLRRIALEAGLGAQSIGATIAADIEEFIGSHPQDDVRLVVAFGREAG